MNRKPEFFTIVGQSGHFSHDNPFICPMNRVGEPVIIRILNAGLNTHSLHIHANHVYVTGVNSVVQENPLWVDTFTSHPLDIFEYTVPYMRPRTCPTRAASASPTLRSSRWPSGYQGIEPAPGLAAHRRAEHLHPAQGGTTTAG